MSQRWTRVTKANPCPACQALDWCAWAPDGNLKCQRTAVPPPGMKLLAPNEAGGVFAPIDRGPTHNGTSAHPPRWPSTPSPVPNSPTVDLRQVHEAARDAVDEQELGKLAADLSVTHASLHAIGIGWMPRSVLDSLKAGGADWSTNRPDGAWSFPERDAGLQIVGFSLRARDGRKGFPAGLKRGLIIPENLADLPDPVPVVEGASDVAACLSLGITAVGRPSNAAGAEMLAELLKDREALVVGENDEKDDGKWPGRDGVVSIAKSLASGWAREVRWCRPPPGVKDIREWLSRQVASGLDLSSDLAWEDAASRLRSALDAGTKIMPVPPVTGADSIRAPIQIERARIESAPVPIEELGPATPPDWVWPGYAAKGHSTLFNGLWKSGKSTLLSRLLHDLVAGGGLVPEPAGVRSLVVSEESCTLWASRRDALGLSKVHVWTRPFKRRASWEEWYAFAERIAAWVREGLYDAVFFDTLGSLWPVDNENDAPQVTAALMPLQAITEAGAALFLIHHPRKGDGAEGTASRGSGALPSFVDIIVEMRRYSAEDRQDKRRVLSAFSRFDETPLEAVLELGENGYTVLGERGEVRQSDRLDIIARVLPSAPPGLSVEEVHAAWPDKPAPGKRTVAADLEAGMKAGRWCRAGEGRKGDPWRYGVGPGFVSCTLTS